MAFVFVLLLSTSKPNFHDRLAPLSPTLPLSSPMSPHPRKWSRSAIPSFPLRLSPIVSSVGPIQDVRLTEWTFCDHFQHFLAYSGIDEATIESRALVPTNLLGIDHLVLRKQHEQKPQQLPGPDSVPWSSWFPSHPVHPTLSIDYLRMISR